MGGEEPPSDLMIQYGYGDENNSIDILIKGGLSFDFRAKLSAILNRHAADQVDKPYNVHAAPFVATGRFRWGPSLSDAEISAAQALVRGGSDASRRQPMNGRLVLECRHNDVTVAGHGAPASGYYSAYLWLMFVLQDGEGRAFHAEPWKNLLVLFEHGNIAGIQLANRALDSSQLRDREVGVNAPSCGKGEHAAPLVGCLSRRLELVVSLEPEELVV